jgi:hypothetical protein
LYSAGRKGRRTSCPKQWTAYSDSELVALQIMNAAGTQAEVKREGVKAENLGLSAKSPAKSGRY